MGITRSSVSSRKVLVRQLREVLERHIMKQIMSHPYSIRACRVAPGVEAHAFKVSRQPVVCHVHEN